MIPEHELEFSYSLSGGPGGQHVQKTHSRVTLRWNISKSQTFNETERRLLIERLMHRLTANRELILHVNSERSQHQNKAIAKERLEKIVREALKVRKKRKRTQATKASKEKRILHKKQRGLLKILRKKTTRGEQD